jgi:hypothetical protein
VQRGGSGSKTVDLVIARYKEDLAWLNEYTSHPFRRVIIYNKGPPMNCPAMKGECIIKELPNVGMCDHTYLYHIVHEYGSLADITVFMPASADLPHKQSRLKETIRLAFKNTPALFGARVGNLREAMKDFQLPNWEVTDPDNKDPGETYQLARADPHPFGAWMDTYLPITCPYVTFNGLFSLSANMIRAKQVNFYQTFLSQLSHHKFPEAAHYIERAWAAMIYPFPDEYFHQIT